MGSAYHTFISKFTMPSETAKQYPDSPDLVEEGELTMEELKEAFRLFDDCGAGFISVARFREILREIDDEISEEELDGIISDIDTDHSDTIDFNEFVKIMT